MCLRTQGPSSSSSHHNHFHFPTALKRTAPFQRVWGKDFFPLHPVDGGLGMASVGKNTAQISALLNCPCGLGKSCPSVGLGSQL